MQEIKKNEDYLVGLRFNLETKYNNQETVNLKLKEIYAEGFSVKVEKLFTFLHYNYMAWQYPDLRYWKYVAPFLIDRTFRCQITNYQKVGTIYDRCKHYKLCRKTVCGRSSL